MQAKSPRLLTALAYAAAGIPVFPCLVNSKLPACKWMDEATTDATVLEARWAEADYNVALIPEQAGWCVIDPDGQEGLDNWAALPGEKPETRVVQTPGGGQHHYYLGSLPSTVGTETRGLCPKVDTRGRGSYVLIPPSVVDDKPYKVLHDRDIAPLPGWIAAATSKQIERVPCAVEQLDLAGNIHRARSLLLALVERRDFAIEGRGGDDRTYRLACELLDLGLSPEVARALLEEIWNPHCAPPWTPEELLTKFANAASYHQNETGAYGAAPAAEVFASALGKIAGEAPRQEKSRFHMEDEDEMEQGKEPSWIVPNLIPEQSTVLLFGPTQSFKSFIALDLALSVSTGTEVFGSTPRTGLSFYAALEGRANIKKARRKAWRLAKGIEGKIPDFYVGPAPMIASQDDVQAFGDEIARRCAGRKPRLIVIDTISKSMAGLNENDAGEASKFIKFCDSLVDTFSCSVIAIGHTGKDGERGHRGSSAFQAGFDTVLEVKAHRATKVVAVWARKHKDAEEPETPWTFEGKLVGPSLVFFPTDAKTHRELTGSEDRYDPKRVGAALQQLNAYGQEQSVTTAILAAQLNPRSQEETDSDYAGKMARASRSLGALAKTKLAGYCAPGSSGLLWSLPGKLSS